MYRLICRFVGHRWKELKSWKRSCERCGRAEYLGQNGDWLEVSK